MLSSSYARWSSICVLILSVLSMATADTSKPDAQAMLPDPDATIRKILGVDQMAKNLCLISSQQMVNAADLPGRLISISADRDVPSDLLRFTFRKPGAKIATQVNPPTDPIQITRIESTDAKSGSFLSWFSGSMSKEDVAEVRTMPMPATSISVDDLDESAITERFSTVAPDVRKGLGIITDVIPYEVSASICKKTTGKQEAGVWYIHLGRDTYAKNSDEVRKYYLVAIYTPIMFYDDIGVIPGTKSVPWFPSSPAKSRSQALNQWLKEDAGPLGLGKFSHEHAVGWIDGSEPVTPR
jgi:hypothetical protein